MPSIKLDLLVKGEPDHVWKQVGDFGSVAQWHPEVTSCEVGQDDQGRALRTLTYSNGHVVVERQTRRDEASHGYMYDVVKGKLPVVGFLGQFMVFGSGGESHIVWTGEFDVVPGFPEERAMSIMDDIVQSAAPGLKAKAQG